MPHPFLARIALAALALALLVPSAARAQDTDDDGIPDVIEPLVGRNPLVRDNDIFTETTYGRRLFVMQMYRDLLGREGESAGIDDMLAQMAGGIPRDIMVERITVQPEFLQSVPPVVRLFLAALGRMPQKAGLQHHALRLAAGVPLATVAETFVATAEFEARYGGLADDEYLAALYRNVLDRAPDPGGLAWWQARIAQGATRAQVLAGFSECPENLQATVDDVAVIFRYVLLLRRVPDPAGYDLWLLLFSYGFPHGDLTAAIFRAPEFRERYLP